MESLKKKISSLDSDNAEMIETLESILSSKEITVNPYEQFFYGLHFLFGLADTTEEMVKLWEAQPTSKESCASSGTQRLVRTACKAFHH